MLAIVMSVLVTILSLMVAFFLAVSNVNFLVDGDFTNKALDNAAIHSLQYGQLGARSGTLNAAHNKTSLNNVTLRVSSQRTTTLAQDIEFVTDPKTLQSKISVSVEVSK